MQNSKSIEIESVKMRTVTVVLPCHNEEKAVAPVLDRLRRLHLEWHANRHHASDLPLSLTEVLIVNDACTDGTLMAIESWKNVNLRDSAEAPFELTVISHQNRKGYGAALKTGIASSKGDYIAFYDVDGTYDPGVLAQMILVLEASEAEMVCGDRLSNCEYMPLTREIGNRFFVGAINLLYRTRVQDSCTGMRVFTKNMQHFFSSAALPDGLDYSLAMTLSFLRTGHRLVEIPIPYSRRIGRSKLLVLWDGPRFFMRILMSWLHTPVHLRQVADERRTHLEAPVVSKKR